VARATREGPRGPDERLESYLGRLGDERRLGSLVGASTLDDVADPIGGDAAAYERAAVEIEELVEAMVNLLWPQGPRSSGGGS
jgi:hypothetical protein